MASHSVPMPKLDLTGLLTPLVREARAAGAIVALDPADPHGTIVLTFAKAADAKAFKAKLSPAMLGLVDALNSMGETATEAGAAFERLAAFAANSNQPDE